MKISATNWLVSIISPVLLLSLHTTLKSNIPRLPCTFLKKGVTSDVN